MLVQVNYKIQAKPGSSLESRVLFADHKQVDGVVIPFRQAFIKSAGEEQRFPDVVVTECKILDRVQDEFFALPSH